MNVSGYMPLRVPAGRMPNSSRINRIAKVGVYSWSILENRSGAARFYVSSTAIITAKRQINSSQRDRR
jgi:hypothetical protein